MIAAFYFKSLKIFYSQTPLYPFNFILYPSLVASCINYQADSDHKKKEHGCQ